MAAIIDGKLRAAEVRAQLRSEAEAFLNAKGRPVGLAIVMVGDDPASATYVGAKEKAAREVGLYSEIHRLPESTDEGAVRRLVKRLGEDDRVDGILVQLPLPAHIDETEILERVPVEKDVDGFTAASQGRLVTGQRGLRSCTPVGIMDLLAWHGVDLQGKRATVVGRSITVGKPMALLLMEKDATVTVLHSKTQEIADRTQEADILVVAVGKPRFVTPEMVKPGAVVVDVGMHRVDGQLVGDVDEGVAQVAGALTPVPGGVGPMTVAMLMKNTLEAARWRS